MKVLLKVGPADIGLAALRRAESRREVSSRGRVGGRLDDFRRLALELLLEARTEPRSKIPNQTVPGSCPSWPSGPAAPVTRDDGVGARSSAVFAAMLRAAASETTGPGGTSSRSCLTALA